MAAWNENPENALREIELHREANDAYFGVPDDDREPEPYDEEWSDDAEE